VAEVLVRDETMSGREIEAWVLPDEITARELLGPAGPRGGRAVQCHVDSGVPRARPAAAARETAAGFAAPEAPWSVARLSLGWRWWSVVGLPG
jgi:hypothetical protein